MLYEVDSSSSDVVIHWTMTGTHVVPGRQQYDEHTPISSSKTPEMIMFVYTIRITQI